MPSNNSSHAHFSSAISNLRPIASLSSIIFIRFRHPSHKIVHCQTCSSTFLHCHQLPSAASFLLRSLKTLAWSPRMPSSNLRLFRQPSYAILTDYNALSSFLIRSRYHLSYSIVTLVTLSSTLMHF